MGKSKQEVPQGSVPGTVFFLLSVNYLPSTVNDVSKLTLFADYTNIIITNSNLTDLKNEINIVFGKINNWFQTSHH
jgi:hypothetical protein